MKDLKTALFAVGRILTGGACGTLICRALVEDYDTPLRWYYAIVASTLIMALLAIGFAESITEEV